VSLITAALLSAHVVAAQRPPGVNPAPEEEIKAAVIANLPKFVEWPAIAFQSPSAPFVVGVLGDDSLAGSVVSAFGGKHLGDRAVSVSRLSKLEDAASCQLVYLSASEDRRLDAVLKSLEGRAVLTIASFGRFAQRGGMIGLIVQDGKVRFEINERAARASGLRLSANLLKLAAAVVAS
jgi:YfiR/HmsC-like